MPLTSKPGATIISGRWRSTTSIHGPHNWVSSATECPWAAISGSSAIALFDLRGLAACVWHSGLSHSAAGLGRHRRNLRAQKTPK
jgi:hypothetical protein